jgi:uncharacterized repeat protein (TIGR02543 family)
MFNTFYREGYLFAGWSLTSTGAVAYADGATYNFSADITLYAKWIPPHTVTFDANDGSGLTMTQTENTPTALMFNTFYREGYGFGGWSLTRTGAVAYTDGATYNFSADITLYAKWIPPHTVTFDANDGSGLTMTQTENTPTVLMPNPFYREGYGFAGWSLTSTGAVAYADGATYNFSADITLYAKWTPPHTVTFDANDGSGLTMTQTENTPAALMFNPFYREGYGFGGWSLTRTGAVAYADGATYNFSADITLYAKWTPPHTVTFDANDGSGLTMTQTENTPTALMFNPFYREGYGFGGWSLTRTGAVAYADGATYNFSADITLYAKWTPPHTVTFDANDGSGLTMTQTENTPAALMFNTFYREGYLFAGWSLTRTGAVTYADGATYNFSADITLYAKWLDSATAHTVTFDPNGGNGSMSPQVANASTALRLNTFTLDGNNFAGWSTTPYDAVVYANGATYDFSADITLYAIWTVAVDHTVTFNANGGSGTMSPQVASTPTALTLNTFTRTGYTFAGWSTTASGAVAYTNGATYNFSADITLFAKWTASAITKTFTSIATQDGWVLESKETTNLGGSLNTSTATFNLGDDAAKKQYRGILSFNTGATLPDNAVITAVTLKVKKANIIGGGNPVSIFQGFMVDIKKGYFGSAATLQNNDFEAVATKSYGPFNTALSGGWYSINLTAAKSYINKLATSSGLTQIRLRFKIDDNNNAIANFLSLYSGNAATTSRPQLIITYTVP